MGATGTAARAEISRAVQEGASGGGGALLPACVAGDAAPSMRRIGRDLMRVGSSSRIVRGHRVHGGGCTSVYVARMRGAISGKTVTT